MTTAYNPFLVLDMPYLKTLLTKGVYYIVVQRFKWPGLTPGCAFIGTAYSDEKKALRHAQSLEQKEGKILDLRFEQDKFRKLFNDARYLLFMSKFKGENCPQRILRHYQLNIASFLKKINILPESCTDINFLFENGQLMIEMKANEDEYKFEVYEIVKQ